MNDITIKEYAETRGVTYEAARQQIKRFEAQLKGHIHARGRTQYIDEHAVALLDEHRQQSSVCAQNRERFEELKKLREENQALVRRVDALQEELLAAQRSTLDTRAKLEASEADRRRLESELNEARRPWWRKL